MFSVEEKKHILRLAIQNNYTAILDIIDAELRKESGKDVYLNDSAILAEYLPKAAEDPRLFNRAIQHLSKIQSQCPVENNERFELFRKIFSNANNGITHAQKVAATEVLLSSEQNFSIRLGLHILKTKIFTLDFIIKHLQCGLSEYPHKILALLSDYAVDISTQHYFDSTLQTLAQESSTKNKSIRKTDDDSGYEEYLKHVNIVSRMLALVIPTTTPKTFLNVAFKFCSNIFRSNDKNHLFAIEFLKHIEKIHPGIIAESDLFINEPHLLARFEILFVLNKYDEVSDLSEIGFALLKKYAENIQVMKLFKQSLRELSDSELASLAGSVRSHNDIPKNVLECLGIDSQPVIKKQKLEPSQTLNNFGPLPPFKEVARAAGVSWPFLQKTQTTHANVQLHQNVSTSQVMYYKAGLTKN